MPPVHQRANGPQNLPPPTEPGGMRPVAAPSPPTSSQPLPRQPQSQPAAPAQAETQQPAPVSTAPTQTQPQPAQPGTQSTDPSDDPRKQLQAAIAQSNEVLATASTVFPLVPFPDIYTIDRAKVTVMKKGLFGTSQVISMRIEDVLSASVTAGMMFGFLQLTNRIIANDQNPYRIGPFWRSDALRLKRITQGYVIAMQKEIDVSKLSANELAHMLERLGEDDHPNVNNGEQAA